MNKTMEKINESKSWCIQNKQNWFDRVNIKVFSQKFFVLFLEEWEKGQKNHKVVFHPWTSLSAWTNIVQQVNITCKITKPKTNKQTTTTKKNLHPLAFKPLWVINRLLLLASESFPGGSAGKEFTCHEGGSILGLERSPRKGKAIHSSTLAWRIPSTV